MGRLRRECQRKGRQERTWCARAEEPGRVIVKFVESQKNGGTASDETGRCSDEMEGREKEEGAALEDEWAACGLCLL